MSGSLVLQSTRRRWCKARVQSGKEEGGGRGADAVACDQGRLQLLFLDTAEIELKVRTEKRRPQDWRIGQEAELRVRDGHTEHVSCHIRNTLQNKTGKIQ